MKIIIDENIPFIKGVFEKVAEVKYLRGSSISKSDVSDADALIIRTRTQCNRELLEGSAVKMIASATIGIDHLDTEWLDKVGIKWNNAEGCNSNSVCQYVASILSLLIIEGLVPDETKLGIVGVGKIGSKVEKLAKTLGFEVLLNDPPRARKEPENFFVDLQTILKKSDIITFHTPLTYNGIDATYHLFDFNALDLLQTDAILINTSRGEVINAQALSKSIDLEKVSLVVLDVWENEPEISTELLEKAWIATPHIAGYSIDGRANGTAMSVQAVSRLFNLGLDDWRPTSLPMPENAIIQINEPDKNQFEFASKAILKTYNPFKDDTLLRKNPEFFEQLRDNYKIRREFGAWTVALQNKNSEKTEKMLEELGFNVFMHG
jgi:erythronate-4-phosphate dehydrogenase